jgi:hypothetical protein
LFRLGQTDSSQAGDAGGGRWESAADLSNTVAERPADEATGGKLQLHASVDVTFELIPAAAK